MLTKDQIFTFLFTWLKTESGLTVIRSNEKGPRPARPYATLKFLNPSTRLASSMDQQSVTDNVSGVAPNQTHTYTVATEGMRSALASINIIGENAIDTLAKVRDSLDRPDVIEKWITAGISHLGDSGITDLTELEETIYEERGQLDLTVAFVSSSEVDVGTIDETNVSGTANGRPVPTVTVNDS